MMNEECSDKQENATRIVIVDDHPVFAEGLVSVIENEPDLKVCGTAANGSQARQFVNECKPHLCIVDVTLEDESGIDLTEALIRTHPGMRVLMVSMHDEKVYAERALRAGASGYVSKLQASSKVIEAIRRIQEGEIFLSDNATSTILARLVASQKNDQPVSPFDSLTNRELEIFRLLGNGCTNPEIADQCNISIRTVESYYRRLKEKLSLNNTAELRQYAIRWHHDEKY
jgi:DNA-binding NarL/FixJ family response regulator